MIQYTAAINFLGMKLYFSFIYQSDRDLVRVFQIIHNNIEKVELVQNF